MITLIIILRNQNKTLGVIWYENPFRTSLYKHQMCSILFKLDFVLSSIHFTTRFTKSKNEVMERDYGTSMNNILRNAILAGCTNNTPWVEAVQDNFLMSSNSCHCFSSNLQSH